MVKKRLILGAYHLYDLSHVINNPGGTCATSRRRCYNVAFKLYAMECIEKKSREAAIRKLDPPTSFPTCSPHRNTNTHTTLQTLSIIYY